MKNPIRKIIPFKFKSLLGLARRLFAAKNPAGRAAMLFSLLGVLMIPLDVLFGYFEKKRYKKQDKPKLPLLFVCGPPRSGTTLVAQVLIKSLPVYYFNNLTSIFPRSPILSNMLFGRFIRFGNRDVTFNSLYGRTARLGAPNDALYLWDRWTGVNRDTIPKEISPENQKAIRHFFAAVEQHSGKPLVNKNNALNTYAHNIADILDTAIFICLDRDPLYLAQSQFIASQFVYGDERLAYGVHFDMDDGQTLDDPDPIELVCRQVLNHKKVMQRQQDLIGRDRFIIVPYEDFCADPAKWVNKIATDVLQHPIDVEALRESLGTIKVSNTIKLEPDTFKAIKEMLQYQAS